MLYVSFKIMQKKRLAITAFFVVSVYNRPTLALCNQTGCVMRHFYLDFIFTAIALAVAASDRIDDIAHKTFFLTGGDR